MLPDIRDLAAGGLYLVGLAVLLSLGFQDACMGKKLSNHKRDPSEADYA